MNTSIRKEKNYITLEELKSWFSNLNSNDLSEIMQFVMELAKSPHIEYHYQLIISKNTTNERIRKSLIGLFDKHGKQGCQFLLHKLKSYEDKHAHAEILFLLGLGRKNLENPHSVLSYARKMALSQDNYTRDRALIVLGWLGNLDDLDLLKDKHLHDTHNFCRAWALTSFMQMWFRLKDDSIHIKAMETIQISINKEEDSFVQSAIIEVVQTLENKKFGIARKSLHNLEKEKIKTTIEKVKRYLNKKHYIDIKEQLRSIGLS